MEIVSFEIAKKLKEKGFNNECYAYYEPLNHCLNISKVFKTNTIAENYNCITAPTISQVLKWLREKNDIMIFPVYSKNTSKWYCSIINADSLESYNLPLNDSYELAALTGIKYCLDNFL